MSEKHLPNKQSTHSKASLPKKPKSKRKGTSTRHGKPSNKNRPALIQTLNGASSSGSAQIVGKKKGRQAQPELKLDTISAESEPVGNGRIAERESEPDIIGAGSISEPSDIIAESEPEPDHTVGEIPAGMAFDQDEAKDSTFFGALLDPDAFLLGDEADDWRDELSVYIELPVEASLSGIEQDAFLLEDEVDVISPDGLNGGTEVTYHPDRAPARGPTPPNIEIAYTPRISIHDRAPARGPTPPNATPAPTGTETAPVSDFDEEKSDEIADREQDGLPQVIDTPVPSSVKEEESSEVPYSVKEWYPAGEPLPQIHDTPLPSYSYKPWYERKRLKALRKVAALCLLALFIASSVLLWRDVTDTHLYVYTLNPSSGDVIAQQDIGGGYQGKSTITNSVQAGSTLVFGVRTAQTSTQVKQQVLTLTGRGTSWQVDKQFAAPLSSGTLSTTTDGHLVVESANGLQVMASNGHVLWSIRGDLPALGAHAYQPASGNEMLYTVQNARLGDVAAFDLANGALHWMAKLDDTFNYSPPLLLRAGILYISGDSRLYALNSADGSMIWQKQWAARSLFTLNNGQVSLLLAVGAQGMTAFDSATGALTWSFNGQPRNKTLPGAESLTAAQFYQAGIDSGNNVIYATGIVWDALQIREQLWLYAVDGTTGTLRWSEPVGSGFVSADAGRIFTPLIDPDFGLVALEQEQDNGDYSISAFDSSTGASRWNVHFDGESAAAPMVLQASRDGLLHLKVPRGKKHLNSAMANMPVTVLILPVTQSSIPTAIHSWSHIRILLIVLIILSLLGSLLLWMLPLHLWILRQQDRIHNIGRSLLYPVKLVLRFWRYSHRLFALAILLVLVGGGVLEYARLNQPENGLYSIAGATGNTQWQRINSPSTQTMLADARGSIDNFTAGDHLHQLSGLDRNGVVQWTTFASEGNFSAPSAPTQPGTVLVALSGPTVVNYQFAPDDPAFPHLQEHILNLYLLNRRTGEILWQTNVVRPNQQQNAVVLGADARFIYIASREMNAGPHSSAFTVQLIAVNESTGNIEWRIFGPREAIDAAIDYGSLLLQSRLISWQVAGTIYSIDSTLGQIQWRRSIIEDDPNILLREEHQMAETTGVLLVERSSMYHVLDATSGNELQGIPNPNTDTFQSLIGVIAVDNIFLIYGGQTLEAIDAPTQKIIWKQEEFDAIKGLKISDDKKMVYVVQLNSVDQNLPRPVQALTALDLKTGTVRWTFQPANQASFVNPQSDGLQYSKGILFATICLSDTQSSCARERLYAINAATGNALWKFEAKSIFDLHVNPDGGAVLLQTHSTAWIDLIGRFRS